MKKLRVTVDGKSYEVLVEILDEERDNASEHRPAARTAPAQVASAQVAAPPSAHHAPSAAAPGEVTSPLAGKVVSIDVQPGQKVAANAQLITLEAMKMNTYVFAPADGVVAAVLVKAGDGVEEGQALIRLA